jgi:tRNA threonylcarbamoyl adenosine modification protein (Sua5/YciO/YrdC/YwlC family)
VTQPTIDEAVAAIQAGGVVVLPTDTVYGLVASPYREEPTRRLYRLKGRDESTPTALICSDLDMLFECVPELRGPARRLARALLPGRYTLVFPNPAQRFPWLTGSSPGTIGVRVPDLPEPGRTVLERVGALIGTSANLRGGPEPTRPEEVPEEIRAGCDVFLEGGDLSGVPSTVLDLTGPEPKVLREGAVPGVEAVAEAARALSSG